MMQFTPIVLAVLVFTTFVGLYFLGLSVYEWFKSWLDEEADQRYVTKLHKLRTQLEQEIAENSQLREHNIRLWKTNDELHNQVEELQKWCRYQQRLDTAMAAYEEQYGNQDLGHRDNGAIEVQAQGEPVPVGELDGGARVEVSGQ